MSENTITVTDTTFETEVIQSNKPIIVDFWANWCGPCKTIGPILEEIAAEKKDTITIAKVDVDQNPKIAAQYKIMSIPTLLFFKNGKVEKTLIGAKNKPSLLKEIESFV